MRAEKQEHLAFRVGGEEYGVDIHKVQELRSYEAPTRIAGAPDYIRGVVNLRGLIVPVIDLRLRMGLGHASYTAFTVVIVLNLGGRLVGAVVDSVSDVVALESDQVKPAPDLPASQHVTGIATLDDRMVLLVEIEQLLGAGEMAMLDKIAA